MASRGHGSMATKEPQEYQPKDALTQTARYGAVSGTFGALIAGIQNTMTRQNPTFGGFFTRFGGTTLSFGGFRD